MPKKKKQSGKKLLLVFKYAKIFTDANPEIYDELQLKIILKIANEASKEIYIDKTYVAYKDSKYEKTFISEEGWNALYDLICMTKFGKLVSNDQNLLMQDSYKAIIVQYVYQFLEDMGYDISNIFVDILSNTKFMVLIRECEINDNYPGKWQSWECNL